MTFSNTILAGEELVRTAIRSSNYVAGVSGWRIDRLGNAEFNGGTFRGDLLVTGANGTVHIYNDPTFGAIIGLTDQGGALWVIRANAFGPNIHNFAIVPQSPPTNLGIGMGYDNIGTTLTLLADDIFDAGPWQTPTLLGTWTNFGGGFQTMRYRKRGRMVDIQGAVAGGTIGTAIFTLPAGFRPPAAVPVPVAQSPSPGNGQVNASGSVLSPTAGSNALIAFSCSIAID